MTVKFMESRYLDSELIKQKVEQGNHRLIVGGMWNELGQLQFEYLKTAGLKPKNNLLDIGCGSLRGGLKFIPYLQPRHYYGFDLNIKLIEAGLAVEVKNAGLDHRVHIDNFAAAKNFNFPSRWPQMDVALGFSLLTHLNYQSLSICLKKTAGVLKKGGKFYATVFEVGADVIDKPREQIPGITTYPDKDPYHYSREQLSDVAIMNGFTLIDIENFGHPRHQKMAIFEK